MALSFEVLDHVEVSSDPVARCSGTVSVNEVVQSDAGTTQRVLATDMSQTLRSVARRFIRLKVLHP